MGFILFTIQACFNPFHSSEFKVPISAKTYPPEEDVYHDINRDGKIDKFDLGKDWDLPRWHQIDSNWAASGSIISSHEISAQ